ncbi:MAG TPA: Omp28-related outer membrane protein [Ignavibacteria bacterium]
MKIRATFSIPSFLIILFIGLAIFGAAPAFASGTVYFLADFENPSFPPAGWTVQNTTGHDVSRTTYCSGYGVGVSSAIVDFYDYLSGNFDLLTYTFPATTSGDSLVFDHAYATAVGGYNDRLDIYTSNNGGSTWTLLISLVGGNSGPLVTAPATNDLFVPTSGQWATKRYALAVGTNKIKFNSVSAFGNSLYLDNIRVGAPYNNDVGVNSISDPKWGFTPGSKIPKAYVRNYGTTTQSFNVTMTINPGGYTNTQSVSNLAPGATQLVNFSSFNFASTGAYTINASTSLGGDQNTSNDAITNTVTVTNAPRKVILEFCTGTWCQWCPCGDDEAHNVATTYPDNAVVFAYHGAGSDPYINFNGNNIIGLLGFSGYPSGLIDRRLGANNGWGSFFFDAEYRLENAPSGTISITSTSINYNQGTRELSVNLNATALTTLSGQYKVNYVITEDNLVYPQTGNSYCPGNPNAIHNWVVRNMVNGAAGSNVNSGTWNANQTYPLTFTTTLNAGWQAGNSKFAVFIFKDNGSLSVSENQQGFQSSYILTGINNQQTGIPDKYSLEQNFPNPFNPVTNVHFSIPKDGIVSFKVYNAVGQLIANYLDGFIKAGNYNAEIEAGEWASGVYFYTLSAKDFIETKKMILVK